MIRPVRLRLSRARGFNLQALSQATNGLPALKVDRGTRWGNPFVVGRDGTAEWCVHYYEALILSGLTMVCERPDMQHQELARTFVLEHRAELRGHNLACWCRPDKPCHADVLLTLACEAAP